MKTIGIVADNYKLDKFKSELTAKGFTDFEVDDFGKGYKVIRVKVQDSQINELQQLVQRVQLHFKQGN
jgi:nitrogen regulatory protein PII